VRKGVGERLQRHYAYGKALEELQMGMCVFEGEGRVEGTQGSDEGMGRVLQQGKATSVLGI